MAACQTRYTHHYSARIDSHAESVHPAERNAGDTMKLLVVNPNTSEGMTRTIDLAARRYAQPQTEIVTVNPTRGPRSIEGYLDAVVAAEVTLELLLAQREAYDAFIIACFSAHGLHAAREQLTAPVFGIGEAAMLMACTLGHRFSVLTQPARSKPAVEDVVRGHGLWQRCASVRTVDMPVLALGDDEAATLVCFADAGRRALKVDGAEVLVLGCAGLAGFDKELERELGVPVLDGVACAVKLAEACTGYGLRTSKWRSFAAPQSLLSTPSGGIMGDEVQRQETTARICCLEEQQAVRLNWKDQFTLRSSLQKTADGTTLMGTEICRKCGALWAYDGRAPAVMGRHVYWYTPATHAMIDRCDEIERLLGDRKDGSDPEVQRALDGLDTELRAARGTRPWLRLVDQGPGAAWAAIGKWEPRPE